MELYICIDENGNCVNHPYFADNLRDAGIEPTNNPEYVPFVRVTLNESGLVLNLLQFPVVAYQKVADVWTDVWSAADLTGDDLLERQTELSTMVVEFIQRRTVKATALMEAATDAFDKQVYQAHIAAVQAFTITDFNVSAINWPKLPTKDQNGNWVV